MIENGRGGDPEQMSRRRRMASHLRNVRMRLTSDDAQLGLRGPELLRLFANSKISATPALVLLCLAIGATALIWVPKEIVVVWVSWVMVATGLHFFFARKYHATPANERDDASWRHFFILLETLNGVIWALIVLALLRADDPNARTFVLVVLLLIGAMTAMIASAIPYAVAGGLMPVMIGIVVALGPTTRFDNLTLSLLCVGVLTYFVVLSNRLHKTSIDTLWFQAEKEALIAELEQAKANSDEARRRAEGANLAKSRFLATMSHELRTPLNAILGFSEVMKAELFGKHAVAAYQEYSTDIHSSGQHLLTLINEILDLSRVEAGRYELKEESISLPNIFEECQHLLAMRARNRGINIVEHLDSELPRLWADERAVRQIILNLLSNAIKFTPYHGTITIKAGWTSAGGQYLSIRDTGPGIPEEEIAIVLSSFGRGSLAQKNADEGTGLGLPIVKGLVELHGGEFRLSSKVREGTEVIVIFPAERVMNALPRLDPSNPTTSRRSKVAKAA